MGALHVDSLNSSEKFFYYSSQAIAYLSQQAYRAEKEPPVLSTKDDGNPTQAEPSSKKDKRTESEKMFDYVRCFEDKGAFDFYEKDEKLNDLLASFSQEKLAELSPLYQKMARINYQLLIEMMNAGKAGIQQFREGPIAQLQKEAFLGISPTAVTLNTMLGIIEPRIEFLSQQFSERHHCLTRLISDVPEVTVLATASPTPPPYQPSHTSHRPPLLPPNEEENTSTDTDSTTKTL